MDGVSENIKFKQQEKYLTELLAGIEQATSQPSSSISVMRQSRLPLFDGCEQCLVQTLQRLGLTTHTHTHTQQSIEHQTKKK